MLLFLEKEGLCSYGIAGSVCAAVRLGSRFVVGSLMVGFGVLCASIGVLLYDAPGPSARVQVVAVPRGGSASVAHALQMAGVLNGSGVFRVFAMLTAWQGPLRSAELSFPARASLAQVLATLRFGRAVQHFLTIPEGLTASRIAGLVEQADGLAGDLVLPDEGAVLPETYAYVLGAGRIDLVRRAARAMDGALAQAWRSRDDGLALGSPRDMLILASLVELETHLGAERPLVARVFLNRLARGMRLQSDPTVVYVESGGYGELGTGVTRQALGRVTPYNTYVLPGLPAGPICAPGIASINAVAHPARSPALYFVANGLGGHVFADSLAEHVRNVREYRHLQQ